MNKAPILSLATALTLIVTPAFAGWTRDGDVLDTVSRMKSEDLLQVRADGYFAITLDEITSTPQMSGLTDAPSAKAKYANTKGRMSSYANLAR
jgi:hypothetical protein